MFWFSGGNIVSEGYTPFAEPKHQATQTYMNTIHISLIQELFATAEEHNLPLWLESGWAAVRCTSWESILWEYFSYIDEVPQSAWHPKGFESYALIRKSLGEAKVEELRLLFESARKNV